jgi:CPA1 family monovalent cation:H+ antiporter
MDFITVENFSEQMLSFIVILVLLDAFILRFDELKKNWKSILFLAIISVMLSVILGYLLLNYTIFEKYHLEIGAIIALMAMILATDPVAVISTFKNYSVPHKLKFLAEGESLFNDAAALIMFSFFGLYLLQGQELTVGYGIWITLKVFVGSIIVGLLMGGLSIFVFKYIKDVLVELVVILFVAYLSFFVAEHLHLSGLLAEIIAILTLTTVLEKVYKSCVEEIDKIKTELVEQRRQRRTGDLMRKLLLDEDYIKSQKDIVLFLTIITMFVNVFLFTELAKLINFDSLIVYWKEILTMFVLATVIRMLMMGNFALLAYFGNLAKMDIKSWLVLTFAGIKGGLSIVMLQLLHNTIPHFKHIELFTAVVTGVILLSMFVYTLGLIITIKLNQKSFLEEIEKERHNEHYID